jgi:hypothetical protein
VICAAIGCTIAAVLVGASTGAVGLIVSVGAVIGGIAGGTVPIRGRTVDEWAPSLWRFARVHGHSELLGVELIDLGALVGRDHLGCMAVAGAPTIVVRLACQGISLLTPGERDRLVNGLTGALDLLAREGSSVSRVSLSATIVDDDGASLLRDLRRRCRGELDVAISSYRELLGAVSGDLPSAVVDLVLRGRPERALQADGILGLLGDADQVLRALEEAGHPRGRILSEVELIEDLGARVGGCLASEGGRLSICGSARFDHLELDGELARSWWVAEWPRHEVSSELLAPVVLGATPLALTIVFEPISPGAALRRAQVARTKGVADDEVRRRGGFLADRRRQREAEHLERREAELVDGHGSLRFAGFLSIRASDAEALRERSIAVELAAAQAGLRLQRCQGDHAQGFVAALPLTTGLR